MAKYLADLGSKPEMNSKHCMVVHAYYPLGETRVEREAQALIESGIDVTVLCPRLPGELAEENVEGVQVIRLPVRRRKESLPRQFLNYLAFLVHALFRLMEMQRKNPFSSVQVHNIPDFLVFSALPLKIRGIPVILDIHDLTPEFFAGRFSRSKGSKMARLIKWQEKVSCIFADHVITVSDHWQRALNDRGVPREKTSVVMNLADPRIFSPPESVTAYLPQGGDLNLIYHGTLVERYGLDLVLLAMHQLLDEGLMLRLTVLGAGDHLATLRNMADDLGLKGQVSFERVRVAAALPSIIRQANLGVVPYRNDVFTDSLLPTKLMEYAAMGLPAVAARTTAIEAYFKDTMVELFEPGDVNDLARCLRSLHGNPGRLLELARGCKRFNRAFNWRTEKQSYVALVRRLISERVAE